MVLHALFFKNPDLQYEKTFCLLVRGDDQGGAGQARLLPGPGSPPRRGSLQLRGAPRAQG